MPIVKVDKEKVINAYYELLRKGAKERGLKTRVAKMFDLTSQRVGQIIKEYQQDLEEAITPDIAIVDTDLEVGRPDRVKTIGEAKEKWDGARGRWEKGTREAAEKWKGGLSGFSDPKHPSHPPGDGDIGEKRPSAEPPKEGYVWVPPSQLDRLESDLQAQADEIQRLKTALAGHGLMIPDCPTCGPDGRVVKYGKRGKTQRFLCRNCDAEFKVHPED